MSNAQYVGSPKSMGMDSTNIVPIDAQFSKAATHVSSFPGVGTYACSIYAGNYGIPSNATKGSVSMTIESSPSNPNYGKVLSVNSSGCSAPEICTSVFTGEFVQNGEQCGANQIGWKEVGYPTVWMGSNGNYVEPVYGAYTCTPNMVPQYKTVCN